jgi:hypothetical protein
MDKFDEILNGNLNYKVYKYNIKYNNSNKGIFSELYKKKINKYNELIDTKNIIQKGGLTQVQGDDLKILLSIHNNVIDKINDLKIKRQLDEPQLKLISDIQQLNDIFNKLIDNFLIKYAEIITFILKLYYKLKECSESHNGATSQESIPANFTTHFDNLILESTNIAELFTTDERKNNYDSLMTKLRQYEPDINNKTFAQAKDDLLGGSRTVPDPIFEKLQGVLSSPILNNLNSVLNSTIQPASGDINSVLIDIFNTIGEKIESTETLITDIFEKLLKTISTLESQLQKCIQNLSTVDTDLTDKLNCIKENIQKTHSILNKECVSDAYTLREPTDQQIDLQCQPNDTSAPCQSEVITSSLINNTNTTLTSITTISDLTSVNLKKFNDAKKILEDTKLYNTDTSNTQIDVNTLQTNITRIQQLITNDINDPSSQSRSPIERRTAQRRADPTSPGYISPNSPEQLSEDDD